MCPKRNVLPEEHAAWTQVAYLCQRSPLHALYLLASLCNVTHGLLFPKGAKSAATPRSLVDTGQYSVCTLWQKKKKKENKEKKTCWIWKRCGLVFGHACTLYLCVLSLEALLGGFTWMLSRHGTVVAYNTFSPRHCECMILRNLHAKKAAHVANWQSRPMCSSIILMNSREVDMQLQSNISQVTSFCR